MTVATAEAVLAQVVVDPTVHELRPDYVALLVAADGLPGGPSDEPCDGWLREAEAAAAGRPAEERPQVARWREDHRSVCNAVYYWQDRRQLAAFARAIPHRAVKACYDRWYDGHQVIVTEVHGAYGHGRLPHITSPISKVRRPLAVRNA